MGIFFSFGKRRHLLTSQQKKKRETQRKIRMKYLVCIAALVLQVVTGFQLERQIYVRSDRGITCNMNQDCKSDGYYCEMRWKVCLPITGTTTAKTTTEKM